MAMFNTPEQQSAGLPGGPSTGGPASGPGQAMPMAGMATPGAVANNASVPGAPPVAQSNQPVAVAPGGNQPAMGIWANPTQSSFMMPPQMQGGDDGRGRGWMGRDRDGGGQMGGGDFRQMLQQMMQNNPQLAQRFQSILSQPMHSPGQMPPYSGQGGQGGQMPGQALPHLPVQPQGASVGGGQQAPQLPGMPVQPSPTNQQQQTPTGIMPIQGR